MAFLQRTTAPSAARHPSVGPCSSTASKCLVRSGRHFSRASRKALTCSAQGGGQGKPLTGNCIVTLKAANSATCTVKKPSSPGASLQEYLNNAADNFANIELPLGGKITRVDSSNVELVIPRFQLFDVWLQPSAVAALSTFNERIEFRSTTEGCVLKGSHHVKDFRLDERFNLDVHIIFRWSNDASSMPNSGTDSDDASAPETTVIYADGTLMVEVDIPPPFSFMPKVVLTAAGNTAMAASMVLVLNAFVSSLGRDYDVWASDPSLRKKRIQAEASVGSTSTDSDRLRVGAEASV